MDNEQVLSEYNTLLLKPVRQELQFEYLYLFALVKSALAKAITKGYGSFSLHIYQALLAYWFLAG